jgi:PAS domain S-box-containing protein
VNLFNSIPVASPVRTSLQLRRPFLVLIIVLLASIGASVAAGLIGIRALERLLHDVTENDAQRLLVATHVRRLFRSEIVLSHDIESTVDAARRRELSTQLETVREERAILLDRLQHLAVPGLLQDFELLRQDHDRMVRLGHDAATRWEPVIADILNVTREGLVRASAEAKQTSRNAKIEFVAVSTVSTALALLLGSIALRQVRIASESVSRSEAQFRAVVQSAPSLLAVLSTTGKLLYAPPRATSFLGTTFERLVEEPLGWVRVEDRKTLETALQAAQAGSAAVASVRLVAMRDDGSTWDASASVTPMFDERCRVVSVILQILDITERCSAERLQRELEGQLLQAQKMETVGKLAGGIAHDFNNLLTAIKGYASLAQQEPSSADLPEFIEGIADAAERASHLTQQLLAFSRKHVIAPVPTDLGALVGGLEKMLVRLIGEDVRLEVITGEQLGHCLVDPNQVEQVVMNLVINARHAMPNGGRLLIDVKNVELDESYTGRHPTVPSGAYVQLSVSDTGEGMSKAVQERIFEPFFTTKPLGQGTGLGLSVVYGTVQQHGGTIDVYSEPGLGTTFRIYWPRIAILAASKLASKPGSERPRGTEVILLVEDDTLVREFARRTLTQQGYRVLCAANDQELANLVADMTDAPGLLVTDVILPGKSGPSLARELQARFPELPVLFTSGYSDHLIAERGQLPPGVDYLQKPFDAGTLAQRVRAAIDRPKH